MLAGLLFMCLGLTGGILVVVSLFQGGMNFGLAMLIGTSICAGVGLIGLGFFRYGMRHLFPNQEAPKS